MGWTIYNAELYHSAMDTLISLHSRGLHMSYTDFGLYLPRVKLKSSASGRLAHISPRYVNSALAPIHWACDLLDTPPLSAMIVHSTDLQPGSSCDGLFDEARLYVYDYVGVRQQMVRIIERRRVLEHMFRAPVVRDRLQRKAQIEAFLCNQ